MNALNDITALFLINLLQLSKQYLNDSCIFFSARSEHKWAL